MSSEAIRATQGEPELDSRETVGKVINKLKFWDWTSRIINDSRNVYTFEYRNDNNILKDCNVLAWSVHLKCTMGERG